MLTATATLNFKNFVNVCKLMSLMQILQNVDFKKSVLVFKSKFFSFKFFYNYIIFCMIDI